MVTKIKTMKTNVQIRTALFTIAMLFAYSANAIIGTGTDSTTTKVMILYKEGETTVEAKELEKRTFKQDDRVQYRLDDDTKTYKGIITNITDDEITFTTKEKNHVVKKSKINRLRKISAKKSFGRFSLRAFVIATLVSILTILLGVFLVNTSEAGYEELFIALIGILMVVIGAIVGTYAAIASIVLLLVNRFRYRDYKKDKGWKIKIK